MHSSLKLACMESLQGTCKKKGSVVSAWARTIVFTILKPRYVGEHQCPGFPRNHVVTFPTLPPNRKISEHCRIHSKFLHKNRICSLFSLNIAKSSFYYWVIIIVALYGLQSPGFDKTVHNILIKWGYLEFSLTSNIYHLFEMIIFKILFIYFKLYCTVIN